jgi:nicotinamidase-related amidase
MTFALHPQRKTRHADNNTRHTSLVALVLIDVINHFQFPDGEKTLRQALPMATHLAKLKQRCRNAGIPAIYVNDNFGQWRSDAKGLIARCLDSRCAGRPFVEQLKPDDEDYLVLKPMHSAFFQTPLEILLQYLGATSLILTGLATNSCIICTAHDANMREFSLYVPSDCCAARSRREHEQAIEHIKEMTSASVVPSTRLRLSGMRAASRRSEKTKA